MLHAPNPTTMTADQRLEEVAAILAAGVLRSLKRQKTEKIPLDKSPLMRPYGRKTRPKGERA